MRCDEMRSRIALLLDGELPANEHAALAAHMAECRDCAAWREEFLWLRRQLMEAREPAPAALAERLRAKLAVEEAETASAGLPSARAPRLLALRRMGRGLAPYWRQAAAVLAACLVSAALTWWWVAAVATRQDIAHDVLAAHVRSLLQDNQVQVASLDTHTVKPWFAGRLDYTPLVKDLSAEGFPLAGGRLDYVDGRRVAALVYRRRLHRISLFIWPDGDAPAPSAALSIEGYNLLTWRRQGMTFWAISDLEAAELGKLETLL